MIRTFTDQDTESYYDAEDEIYRSLWDEDGSVHWGVFDSSTGDDFLKAGANLNRMMVDKGGITKDASVLDVGCGNGTIAIWLSQTVGCAATGIDLSGVRIENAQGKLAQLPAELRARLAFKKASAADLPFADETFTHVWSQACIYHVHDQETALREAYRVLQSGGIFVFDDLFKPKSDVSTEAQKYVYERLYFNTDYNYETYQNTLKSIGFEILETQDLSAHLAKSYTRLADMADEKAGEHKAHFEALSLAYRETVKAVERDEVGWGLFVCRKTGVQTDISTS